MEPSRSISIGRPLHELAVRALVDVEDSPAARDLNRHVDGVMRGADDQLLGVDGLARAVHVAVGVLPNDHARIVEDAARHDLVVLDHLGAPI